MVGGKGHSPLSAALRAHSNIAHVYAQSTSDRKDELGKASACSIGGES